MESPDTNKNLSKEQIAQNDANTPFVGINGEVTGLGFASRDQGAKIEEDSGALEFNVIKNDRSHLNMKLLIDLKNIFSRQLPKMPKEYIVKLVFDRNHEAMIIHKNKEKVIGGICFRRYPTQRFAEIAFLAVTATEQVKGYGTRLMNKFKEHMQSQDIEYLMTYADNFAIGYFKKQGFTKEYRMPQERWKGFIKDYEGGTMMECYVHPYIDYSNISNIIKNQKAFVVDIVKKLCLNGVKFPGINVTDKMIEEKEQKEGTPLINPEQIQGIIASGWTWSDFDELRKSKEKSFNLQCQNIIDSMRKHKASWPFLDAVNKDDVPDYYDIITYPIDIKAIERKLIANEYRDKQSFLHDIKSLFNNCRVYNQPDTVYYKAANELENYINPYLNTIKDSNDPTRDTEYRLSSAKKKKKYNNK